MLSMNNLPCVPHKEKTLKQEVSHLIYRLNFFSGDGNKFCGFHGLRNGSKFKLVFLEILLCNFEINTGNFI